MHSLGKVPEVSQVSTSEVSLILSDSLGAPLYGSVVINLGLYLSSVACNSYNKFCLGQIVGAQGKKALGSTPLF